MGLCFPGRCLLTTTVICTFNKCETVDEMHGIKVVRLFAVYNVNHALPYCLRGL